MYSVLTTVENVAWWLADVRQDDVVLSKPLPVKKKVNNV